MELIRYDHPLAVCIPPSLPPEKLPGLARAIEELRFRDVWAAEDYFELAGFASAGTILGSTSKLRCGLGIVSSVTRHPAVTAMEIATLGRAFPGRLTAGIGHGVPAWTRQMGVYPASPLGVLREVVTTIRRLLDGETVTERAGHFHFDAVHLAHPLPGAKLLTGVLGPRSLELSGEVADGTLGSVLIAPPYIEEAEGHISRGAARSGRKRHEFPILAIFACDPDRNKARAAAAGVIAHYLVAVGPTALTAPLGLNERIAELQALGDPKTVAKEMPDEWIDDLAVAGDPDECTQQIRRLLSAGAAQVSLVVAAPEQIEAQLTLAAREILPTL
jgi:alkanesulfonate monooxygenase SsuD/methylene tetrahydromethanopterin reductase-like flavin-dependent oxidoreductase (luciferase family)